MRFKSTMVFARQHSEVEILSRGQNWTEKGGRWMVCGFGVGVMAARGTRTALQTLTDGGHLSAKGYGRIRNYSVPVSKRLTQLFVLYTTAMRVLTYRAFHVLLYL